MNAGNFWEIILGISGNFGNSHLFLQDASPFLYREFWDRILGILGLNFRNFGAVPPLECTDEGSGFIFPPSHFDFSVAPHKLTVSAGRVQGCSPHPGFGGTLMQQELGMSTQDPSGARSSPAVVHASALQVYFAGGELSLTLPPLC